MDEKEISNLISERDRLSVLADDQAYLAEQKSLRGCLLFIGALGIAGIGIVLFPGIPADPSVRTLLDAITYVPLVFATINYTLSLVGASRHRKFQKIYEAREAAMKREIRQL